jgi:hypothetical protein
VRRTTGIVFENGLYQLWVGSDLGRTLVGLYFSRAGAEAARRALAFPRAVPEAPRHRGAPSLPPGRGASAGAA